jgi:hypothetical protein
MLGGLILMFNSTAFEKDKGVVGEFKGYKIQTVDIRPGDTILLHLNDDVDIASCNEIMNEMKKTFPDNHILFVNEWVLKGMTVIRQAKPIADSVDEIILNEPLEKLYPDLFGSKTGLKPGEILW